VCQLEHGNDLVTLLEQISTSQDLRRAESDSRLELTKTVSQRVGTLTSGMAAATSLESLKSQVTHNLSDIVGALEKHNTSSDANDKSLSDELASMAERVKQMEKAAVEAEEKIEAQRVRALVDPLTHLPNREAYDQRAHQEIARWMRYQRSLCLAVCDLDLFKRVNDEFGHLAGDKVLKIVAKLIRERLRASDFISRFGGEEFVILLPETEAKEAVAVMEEIREAIANTPFHFRHKQVQITVSIGLTMFQGKDNLKNAFTRADKAMYEAKDSGRNCCRLSSLPEEISDPVAVAEE
jgi:diguanylate cyclase